MAFRERPTPALDAAQAEDRSEDSADALAAAAEAEAVAAEAEARAAAARAHAIRLRQQVSGDVEQPATGLADSPPWWRRRPGRKVAAVGSAIVLLCSSLAASGYLIWHHRMVSAEQQRAAEFTAAASELVVALMSLDSAKTGEDVQRIADISTGEFKDRFPLIAAEITKRLQQAKVATTATVNEVAIESMSADAATVLVAATTDAKRTDNGQQAAQEPQSWHIALGLTRDGGQPKISRIEFVQ